MAQHNAQKKWLAKLRRSQGAEKGAGKAAVPQFLTDEMLEDEPLSERPRIRLKDPDMKDQLQRLNSVTNADGTLNWMAFAEKVAPLLAEHEQVQAQEGAGSGAGAGSSSWAGQLLPQPLSAPIPASKAAAPSQLADQATGALPQAAKKKAAPLRASALQQAPATSAQAPAYMGGPVAQSIVEPPRPTTFAQAAAAPPVRTAAAGGPSQSRAAATFGRMMGAAARFFGSAASQRDRRAGVASTFTCDEGPQPGSFDMSSVQPCSITTHPGVLDRLPVRQPPSAASSASQVSADSTTGAGPSGARPPMAFALAVAELPPAPFLATPGSTSHPGTPSASFARRRQSTGLGDPGDSKVVVITYDQLAAPPAGAAPVQAPLGAAEAEEEAEGVSDEEYEDDYEDEVQKVRFEMLKKESKRKKKRKAKSATRLAAAEVAAGLEAAEEEWAQVAAAVEEGGAVEAALPPEAVCAAALDGVAHPASAAPSAVTAPVAPAPQAGAAMAAAASAAAAAAAATAVSLATSAPLPAAAPVTLPQPPVDLAAPVRHLLGHAIAPPVPAPSPAYGAPSTLPPVMPAPSLPPALPAAPSASLPPPQVPAPATAAVVPLSAPIYPAAAAAPAAPGAPPPKAVLAPAAPPSKEAPEVLAVSPEMEDESVCEAAPAASVVAPTSDVSTSVFGAGFSTAVSGASTGERTATSSVFQFLDASLLAELAAAAPVPGMPPHHAATAPLPMTSTAMQLPVPAHAVHSQPAVRLPSLESSAPVIIVPPKEPTSQATATGTTQPTEARVTLLSLAQAISPSPPVQQLQDQQQAPAARPAPTARPRNANPFLNAVALGHAPLSDILRDKKPDEQVPTASTTTVTMVDLHPPRLANTTLSTVYSTSHPASGDTDSTGGLVLPPSSYDTVGTQQGVSGGVAGAAQQGQLDVRRPFYSTPHTGKRPSENGLTVSAASLQPLEPQYWSIPQSDITLIRKLGSGSYGEVWLASYHFVDVAVKLVPWMLKALSLQRRTRALKGSAPKSEEFMQSEQELAKFRQEVDFQRRLSLHPNIVPFIGACEPWSDTSSPPPSPSNGAGAQDGTPPVPTSAPTPRKGPAPGRPPPSDQLVIVMGYCKLGDVFNMIRKARQVGRLMASSRPGEAVVPASLAHAMVFWQNWEKRLDVAAGAAAGLYHMHSKGVVHRDLTSYNVLLDSGFSAKLADFNLSRVVPRGATNMMLTNSGSLNSPLWQPPEFLRGEEMYDGKSLDVFSFGIILSEIITLWVPYTSGSEEEATAIMSDMRHIWPLIGKIVSGMRPQLPSTRSELSPPLPSSLSQDKAEEVFNRLINLTQSCWHASPSQRPSMDRVAGELRDLVNILRQARQNAAAAAAYEAGNRRRQAAAWTGAALHGVY